jgi:hypothetical protein
LVTRIITLYFAGYSDYVLRLVDSRNLKNSFNNNKNNNSNNDNFKRAVTQWDHYNGAFLMISKKSDLARK